MTIQKEYSYYEDYDYWEDGWIEMQELKEKNNIKSLLQGNDYENPIFYNDPDFEDLENIFDENGEIGWGEMSYRRYSNRSAWELL